MCYQVKAFHCKLCDMDVSVFKECRNGVYPDDVCKEYLDEYAYDNIIVPCIDGVNPVDVIYLCGSCAEDAKRKGAYITYDIHGLLPTKDSSVLNCMVSVLRQNDECVDYYSIVCGYEREDGKIAMVINDNSNIST